MNANRMIVGEFYWAEYSPDCQSKQKFTGKVFLEEMHYPIKGWHKVRSLDDNGIYYASSRGISHHIDSVKVTNRGKAYTTSGHSGNIVMSGNNVLPVKSAQFDIDQIIDPVREEVDKLRKLGYDDKTRSDELGKICLLLEGFGIRSSRLPDDTGISIAWADLAVLKAFIQKMYMRDMMEFDDDLP